LSWALKEQTWMPTFVGMSLQDSIPQQFHRARVGPRPVWNSQWLGRAADAGGVWMMRACRRRGSSAFAEDSSFS